jgi:hypothetical protein
MFRVVPFDVLQTVRNEYCIGKSCINMSSVCRELAYDISARSGLQKSIGIGMVVVKSSTGNGRTPELACHACLSHLRVSVKHISAYHVSADLVFAVSQAAVYPLPLLERLGGFMCWHITLASLRLVSMRGAKPFAGLSTPERADLLTVRMSFPYSTSS